MRCRSSAARLSRAFSAHRRRPPHLPAPRGQYPSRLLPSGVSDQRPARLLTENPAQKRPPIALSGAEQTRATARLRPTKRVRRRTSRPSARTMHSISIIRLARQVRVHPCPDIPPKLHPRQQQRAPKDHVGGKRMQQRSIPGTGQSLPRCALKPPNCINSRGVGAHTPTPGEKPGATPPPPHFRSRWRYAVISSVICNRLLIEHVPENRLQQKLQGDADQSGVARVRLPEAARLFLQCRSAAAGT
jgi:hypothetical protein